MSNLHVLNRPGPCRWPSLPSSMDLELAMERTLSHLADVDRRYEHERGAIEGALHPQPWKDWRLGQLDQRHQKERQPLVQLLCLLHQQLASGNLVLSDDERELDD
jgi:hypothetical protein